MGSGIAQTCSVDPLTAQIPIFFARCSLLVRSVTAQKPKKPEARIPIRGKLLLALVDDSLPST
jgi:hypothetical protein